MKNLVIGLFFATCYFSCNKDKDAGTPSKTFLVSRSTTVGGSSNSVMRYNRNSDGRLTSYVGPSQTDSVVLTYDSRGRIATLRFTQFGQNGYDYTYDDQGRVALAQGYNNDGSKNVLSTFTYFDDRVEEVLLYPGNLLNKRIYTYTADKKNQASYKLIGTSGNVAEEETYTYAAVKAQKYGYEQIRAIASENAVQSSIRVNYTGGVAGTPITFTRKITANADGYPASIENSASNSSTVTTTTYEYMAR